MTHECYCVLTAGLSVVRAGILVCFHMLMPSLSHVLTHSRHQTLSVPGSVLGWVGVQLTELHETWCLPAVVALSVGEQNQTQM